MAYPCPFGCERKGRPLLLATVKGWKRHMTDQHRLWSEDQLKAAVEGQSAEATAQPAETTFDNFANSLPESEQDATASDSATSTDERPAAGSPGVANVKTEAVAKKLNVKMAKLKRQLCEAVPRAIDSGLKSKGPGWALTKEYKDMITESIEGVFDMLDVQFQIQQLNVELKSRAWVFFYPVAVILMVLGLLAAKNSDKEIEGSKPEPEPDKFPPGLN